ncbi:MAG: peptidoglycan-binding domain-containing protein [bacterium]
MVKRSLMGLAVMAGLAACDSPIPVAAPSGIDLSTEAVHVKGNGPPPGPEGTCWAHDRIPAVFETETEQSLVSAEVLDADGAVVSPATYRSVAKLRMVHDNDDIWFKAPCPDLITVDFLATLQRALKARGYYTLPLTGEMDAATTEAVRTYQADHGLDSPELSLAAARQLGLSATALDQL